MFDFIKKKYENGTQLEVLKLEDLVSEEEKSDFLLQINRLEHVNQDQVLNEELRQSIKIYY